MSALRAARLAVGAAVALFWIWFIGSSCGGPPDGDPIPIPAVSPRSMSPRTIVIDARTAAASPTLGFYRPSGWNTVLYESDLCDVLTEQLDTVLGAGNPNEWLDGNGDWYIVYYDSASGYTSGGAVSGFTPTKHISDDISSLGLDFYGTGCAFEGRQDDTSPPIGQGASGGNGPPAPRLRFSDIGVGNQTKVFFVAEIVTGSSSFFSDADYTIRQAGTKIARLLVNGCENSPAALLFDWISNSTVTSGCGRVSAMPSCVLEPPNVWQLWPTHLDDTIPYTGGNCWHYGSVDQPGPGELIRIFGCLDTDPDHDSDPSDGDEAVVSFGFDEAEGVASYWTPADFDGVYDPGYITGFMYDNTWGGNGTRPGSFSRWLTYLKIWSGDGTSTTCYDPGL